MTECLLDDLHSDLHRGEKCPECGHDPYAETPVPVEDLRPWGWAPGSYVFKCRDCPPDLDIYDKMARLGDKRSVRCQEHAIAARDAAAAKPKPDIVGAHRAHCYQGEYAGTCKYGDHDCPAAVGIYVIWWTTQTDCEFVDALCEVDDGTIVEWPDWLRIQWSSRDGRNGRGRLWNAFPDALPGGIDPWPDNLLGRRIGGDTTDTGRHSAAGIVIPLGDLNLVIGLPGFVTTAQMTRLLIHGVDLDL